MADWSELKRLAEAVKGINLESAWPWAQTIQDSHLGRTTTAYALKAGPEAVLALIAENEEQAERLRMFELIHGGRASELVSEMHALRAEVRRLKILAGEDVPPLPEEFVGPLPENCNARLRRKLKEQAGPPAIPANLNGLADAAFAMADRGEDPSDMLAMLQAGLKKAQPQWSEQKTRTVNGMCMTWRHDFGLDKREHDFGSCGMADAEREALRAQMGQLYEHHIAPVIAENEESAANLAQWQKAFVRIAGDLSVLAVQHGDFTDESTLQQAIDFLKGAMAERDQLKAESERSRKAMEEAIGEQGREISKRCKAEIDLDQMRADREALRTALQEVAGLVDGDLRELARDLVNAFSGLKNGTNPNDIYDCCDKIDQVIGSALGQDGEA